MARCERRKGEDALFSGRKKLCKKDVLAMLVGCVIEGCFRLLIEWVGCVLVKYAPEIRQ